MKFHRRLSQRMLLVSILSGIVGLVIATMSVRYATERLGAQVMCNWLKRASLRQKSRCEEQPDQWTAGIPGGPIVFGYDAETLTSRNPAAPPLAMSAYDRLSKDTNEPIADVHSGLRGASGVVLIRTGNAGPCAILQAVWPPVNDDRALVAGIAGVIGAVFAAAALGFFFVGRPLAARVGRLAGAAIRVGDPTGYAPVSRAADDELDRVADALDRAHDRIRTDAKRLDERRRYLERHLADVAHDLKTPLTSLQLAIEQAADHAPNDEQAELLARSLRDCVYLGGLVSNLRLASEMEEGWDPVAVDSGAGANLKEVVERVVARLVSLARRRGIELEHATPDRDVFVACNLVACEQALGNLVENAVSYGDRGGHVAVLLEMDPPDAFRLTVLDDGPGVLPEEIPRLGERTFRSDDARRRDPRGSGLGLAITGEVCRRAGFTLTFESAGERGLCVRIGGKVQH